MSSHPRHPDSAEPRGNGALEPAQRATLLRIARESIAYGLEHGAKLPVDPAAFTPPLCDPRATFVTLHRQDSLRGCIGTLEPMRALVADVAHQAHAAAFHDPRFPALASHELADLVIHISILSPAEPIHCTDEADLICQLRPGADGLILVERHGLLGKRKATFLPSVWDTLPDPREFLRHLKVKAGMPADYWSDRIRVWRYTTESVHEP